MEVEQLMVSMNLVCMKEPLCCTLLARIGLTKQETLRSNRSLAEILVLKNTEKVTIEKLVLNMELAGRHHIFSREVESRISGEVSMELVNKELALIVVPIVVLMNTNQMTDMELRNRLLTVRMSLVIDTGLWNLGQTAYTK